MIDLSKSRPWMCADRRKRERETQVLPSYLLNSWIKRKKNILEILDVKHRLRQNQIGSKLKLLNCLIIDYHLPVLGSQNTEVL